jgi:hypothetical protein
MGKCQFNHLINTLILPLKCGFKFPFNRCGQTREIGGELMVLRFDAKTFDFDIMLNYQSSYKFKSIGKR